jgi:hypothetical protein
MAKSGITKRSYKVAPGMTVECKSGRFLAFYDHRTDIIANGDNEVAAKKNLKVLYKLVMDYEKAEEEKKTNEVKQGKVVDATVPKDMKTRRFIHKLTHA